MKYKLIKTYPGSPKLGYIDDLNKSGHNNQGEYVQSMYDKNPKFWEKIVEYSIGTKVLNSETKSIYTKKEDGWYMLDKTAYTDEQITKSKHIHIIENKIIEKDYEILSFYNEDDNFCKVNKTNYIEKFVLDNLHIFKIHSVKRLSDSEIFTIGDKINNGLSNNCIIDKIYINDNKLIVDMRENGWQYLNYIKKVKTSLFQTEDGVDIFEGDDIYSIDDVLNIKKHRLFNARYDDKTLLNNRLFFNSDYKHFSTLEKAEEYILYNKPLLTLRDIDELLCKNTSSYFLEKFKKRAQKLNNKN